MTEPRTNPDVAAVDGPTLASAWLLAVRAMTAASGRVPRDGEGAAGLYAQSILGLTEEDCLVAKSPERLGVMSLVSCLAILRRLPHDTAEQFVTGVMTIAYRDAMMHPLEVRWASMVTSAAGLSAEEFQRCCVQARVIASMLRPRQQPQEGEA